MLTVAEPLESLYDPSENINSNFYQPLFLKNYDDELEELKEELQIDENMGIHFIQGDFFVYYEEGDILGEGMSGTVKKCTKVSTNEIFAVKIVRYRGDTELLHLVNFFSFFNIVILQDYKRVQKSWKAKS